MPSARIVSARAISAFPCARSELPPGVALFDLTMDQFMDLEDSFSKRPERV